MPKSKQTPSAGNTDILAPYLRVADTTFQNGFESDEMKTLFLDNVFNEISGYELKLTLGKSSGYVLKKFANAASSKNLLQLLKVFQEHLEEMFESEHGFHVFTQSLTRLVILLQNADNNDTTLGELIENVVSCCRLIKEIDQLPEWMMNSTKIFRSLLATLAGTTAQLTKRQQSKISNKEKNKTSDIDQEITLPKEKVPAQFLDTLQEIAKTFTSLSKQQTVELICNDRAAPCICTLLKVTSLRTPTSLELICKRLLSIFKGKNDNDWSTLVILTKDRIGSHVIDSLLESKSEETRALLFKILCDRERLIELACHPVANHVVQRLLVLSVSANQFEMFCDAFLEIIEDILAEGNYGIIQKIAEQCLKVKSRQKPLINSLLQAFHCYDSEQARYFVSLLASFSTYDTMFKDVDKVPPLTVRYHGSVLLQTLLRFDDPSAVARSLTKIPPEHVVKLSCDVAGSHVVDAFFESKTVKQKTLLNFLNHVKDEFHLLARDKYGNKILWNMWSKLTIPMKTIVAESLVDHEDLPKHPIGKFVLIHLRLKDFVEKRLAWESFQLQQERKRKAFAEFLSDDSDKKRTKGNDHGK